MDFLPKETREGLWYLGSPYSHEDPAMRERRFRAVARVAGKLYEEEGVKTYCPIAHTHPIEVELLATGAEVRSYEFWLPWDFEFFPAMRGLIITRLPGWRQSKGLSQEIPKMLGEGKPCLHVDPRRWFTRAEWQELGGQTFD